MKIASDNSFVSQQINVTANNIITPQSVLDQSKVLLSAGPEMRKMTQSGAKLINIFVERLKIV